MSGRWNGAVGLAGAGAGVVDERLAGGPAGHEQAVAPVDLDADGAADARLAGHEQGARDLFAEFAPTLDFFEATVGPYPFGDEKLGVVETPPVRELGTARLATELVTERLLR